MTIPIILVILQTNVTTEKDACQGFLGLKMLWTVKLGKRRFQSSSDYRLGAGEGIRTLDILLGKYLALSGVAIVPDIPELCKRKLSSYGVKNPRPRLGSNPPRLT